MSTIPRWTSMNSAIAPLLCLGIPLARATRGAGPIQVPEQGDLRHVVDELEVARPDDADEWQLGGVAPGVLAVPDGVELVAGYGRDAVAPAVHRRPEPLQRHRGRGAEVDQLLGRLAPSEGPLPVPGKARVQVPQPPGDRGDRGRVGVAGRAVELPLARPERPGAHGLAAAADRPGA